MDDDAGGTGETDWDEDSDIGDVEDFSDFRAALRELLVAAEAAGVSHDAMAGLLTVYLARLRGDVRLPLGMEPERARQFRDRAADHRGERMEVELVITPDVLEELDLQLRAFEPLEGENAGSGE